MKRFAAALGLCALLVQSQALAEAPGDALSWLGRIAAAGQRLDYTGTFIYQSGRNFETSRITHLADASGEYERLEVLDGSPREVIRSNTEVQCVLPEQKTIIIDRPGGRRVFPARLPVSFAGLAENYRIRKGELSRVAGLETQLIVLEPKDDLRYGHLLWAELQSGLLLKARMVDERGDILEQFTFSNVKIGGPIDAETLKPRYAKDGNWRVINAHGIAVEREDSGWVMNAPLPGFALTSIVRRPLGRDRGEALHLVYSDGMAAISVFIEPMGSNSASADLGPLATGAINIYKRRVDGHLVTALGEVPLRAVQRLGDGIGPRTQ
jgi:sigma-E factor negative regulatory protein RseB